MALALILFTVLKWTVIIMMAVPFVLMIPLVAVYLSGYIIGLLQRARVGSR